MKSYRSYSVLDIDGGNIDLRQIEASFKSQTGPSQNKVLLSLTINSRINSPEDGLTRPVDQPNNNGKIDILVNTYQPLTGDWYVIDGTVVKVHKDIPTIIGTAIDNTDNGDDNGSAKRIEKITEAIGEFTKFRFCIGIANHKGYGVDYEAGDTFVALSEPDDLYPSPTDPPLPQCLREPIKVNDLITK